MSDKPSNPYLKERDLILRMSEFEYAQLSLAAWHQGLTLEDYALNLLKAHAHSLNQTIDKENQENL